MSQAPGPTIQTDRLILRPTSLDDLPRWIELMGDPQASKFIGGPLTPQETWRALMGMAGAWTLTGVAMFSVIEKATGLWIGRLGPWRPLGWPGDEVGWSLHPDAWGRGYAVEGATAAMNYAFDVLGWDDVIHCIAPDNHASARVADRLGSTNRGPGRMPPPFQNIAVDLWGQTRDQWRARKAGSATGPGAGA